MSVNVKKPHVYSVLFMRDDSGVTRFRIRAAWLKFMLFLFILMTLAAGAGGWATHYYWQRYEYHKAEARELDSELTENRRQLVRLVNLEKFLEANDPVLLRTIMSSVTVPDTIASGDPLALAAAGSNGGTGGDGGRTDTGAGPADGQNDGSAPDGATGAGGIGGTAPDGANPGGTNPGGTENGQAAPPLPPENPVKLSNVQIRPSSSRIFVSFDLGNLDSSQPLSGRVSLALVDGGGKVLPVANVSSESGLRFTQIVRYKPISATMPLPQGTAMADIAAVRVSVETEGNPPFAQRLPMPLQ